MRSFYFTPVNIEFVAISKEDAAREQVCLRGGGRAAKSFLNLVVLHDDRS